MPSASDAFNRAGEAPLAGPWGAWGTLSRPVLSASACLASAANIAGYARYISATFANDQYSEIRILSCGMSAAALSGTLNAFGWVMVRTYGGAGAHTGYVLQVKAAAAQVWHNILYKFVGGAATFLTSAQMNAHPSGHLFGISAVGTAISTTYDGTWNPVFTISASDSAIASGAPGFGVGAGMSSVSAQAVDDWFGTDGAYAFVGTHRRKKCGVGR